MVQLTPLQKRMLKSIDATLSDLIKKKNPPTLYDPLRYSVHAGGKRIRPLFLLLSCNLVSSDFRPAIPAATSIEILHNFSLIHDDIMDQDDLRRGRPTVHRKWDTGIAILSGDVMVALAYKALTATPIPDASRLIDVFNDAFIDLCEGQALDKEFETKRSVSTARYIQMIDRKTARLFSISTEIGAIVGGGSTREVKLLREFGRMVGIAFQIQDDLLDVISDAKTLGKDIGSDLIHGKKTYVVAKINRTKRGKDLLRRFYGNRRDSSRLEENLGMMKAFLKREKIIEEIKSDVSEYLKQATDLLSGFENREGKSELLSLTKMVLNRKS